jgi:hypothetical protein
MNAISSWRIKIIVKPGDEGRVSGSSNLDYCTNSEQAKGILMHPFPNNETDPQSERKSVNFIRKH